MRRFRLRSRLLRARGVALSVLATGIVLLSAALVLVLLDELLPADDAAPPGAAATAAGETATAVAVKLDGRMEAAAIEAAQVGRRSGDLSSLSAFELPPPLRSVDAASFRDGDRIVRLAGVEAPRANDVCLDGEARWSCGLQARAALHNIVAGRSLFCQPRNASADGGITADCRLDVKDALPAGDVAYLLVRQGWVRPMPGSEAAFAADAEATRAAGAGLWRGGWRIISP